MVVTSTTCHTVHMEDMGNFIQAHTTNLHQVRALGMSTISADLTGIKNEQGKNEMKRLRIRLHCQIKYA
uniref:Uncharacterized protein n=1 Tax=Rhizophora mucronata TaxID=61149 RepID=A0A2P2NME2_RHIMU